MTIQDVERDKVNFTCEILSQKKFNIKKDKRKKKERKK